MVGADVNEFADCLVGVGVLELELVHNRLKRDQR